MLSTSGLVMERLELLWEQFQELSENDPDLDLKQFAEGHPTLHADILRVFPILEKLQQLIDETDDDAKAVYAARQAHAWDSSTNPFGFGDDAGEIGAESIFQNSPAENSRQLGKYTLLRPIGIGGMGVVFEASRTNSNERVALKIISPRYASSISLERFEREVRAATALHHSNIVPVYDFDRDGGTAFFTMRLIDGPNLADVIHSERFDSLKGEHRQHARSIHDQLYQNWVEIANLTCQTARALAHAHAHGVLHRDIKPANLIVEDNLRVWITDFGVAKFGSDLTQTRQAVGTPRYMPPEQLRGRVDERSDLFALALTLYELCVMRPLEHPNGDASKTEAGDAEPSVEPLDAEPHQSHEPHQSILPDGELGGLKRPRELAPQLPIELEEILMKGLQLYPDQRYQTAGEFAEDLKQFVNRHEAAERLRRTRRRRLVKSGVIGLVAILVGSLLAVPDPPLPRGVELTLREGGVLSTVENQCRVAELNGSGGKQWRIVGGSDSSRFVIRDHVLEFQQAPNFEGPADENGDNRYDLELAVVDKIGNAREFPVRVHVLNAPEPPVFFVEDRIHAFRPGELMRDSEPRVTDDDCRLLDGVSLSLVNDGDRDQFAIDPLGGALFPLMTSMGALDGNRDGVFELTIEACDRSYVRCAGASGSRIRFYSPRHAMGQSQDTVTTHRAAPLLGLASADGSMFFELQDNGDGTTALWVSLVQAGGAESRCLNGDCGLSSSLHGLATADGRRFFALADEGGESLSLLVLDLREDHSFAVRNRFPDSKIPRSAESFSTIDGRVFYHRRVGGVDNLPTFWVSALLQDGAFLHHHEPAVVRQSAQDGEAAWLETDVRGLRSQMSMRFKLDDR